MTEEDAGQSKSGAPGGSRRRKGKVGGWRVGEKEHFGLPGGVARSLLYRFMLFMAANESVHSWFLFCIDTA